METALETIQRTSAISFPGLLGDFSMNPPASFVLFGRNIYFYGVIIALGFLLGITYCTKNAKRFGIREDDVYDLVLWLIPLSIIGARLYFVAFKLDYYLAHPEEIVAIWNGGLAIYGGVIAGVIVMLFVCRRKKIPWQAMLDLIVYGLLIGQILGRWGNFMNREAFRNGDLLPHAAHRAGRQQRLCPPDLFVREPVESHRPDRPDRVGAQGRTAL